MLHLTLQDFRRAGVDKGRRDPGAARRDQQPANPAGGTSDATSETTCAAYASRRRGWPNSCRLHRRPPGRVRRPRDDHDRLSRLHPVPARSRGTRRPGAISSRLPRLGPGRRTTRSSTNSSRCAEQAHLLGYSDWPWDAEVKMIREGAAIGEFIDRIADPPSTRQRDLAPLLERRGATTPRSSISPRPTPPITPSWSGANATTSTRRRCASTSTSPKVRAGLLEVTGRLF